MALQLLEFQAVYDFLTIYDISKLDCSITNKKKRKFLFSIFKTITINTINEAIINDDLFIFKSFFDYIKKRKLAISGYVFNYTLTKKTNRYYMPNQNNDFIQYLKIFRINMKEKQLINILYKYKNLKTLLLNSNETIRGCEYNDEYHYWQYSKKFRQYISINFTKIKNIIIESLLNLENFYICFSSNKLPIINIINASPNLKKIIIKTDGNNYLPLIFCILEKKQINEIKIYDSTICNKSQFCLVVKILDAIALRGNIIKLEMNTGDISGGNGHLHQTIIILYTNNIKISFVIHYIICHNEMQLIFNHCPNLEFLSIAEHFDEPEYFYLFNHNILYPSKLETIVLNNESNEIHILNVINEIKTIKKIYISFYMCDDELPPFLIHLMEVYKHITFIKI